MIAIILLSIIQGFSEFLPISSSAHLIIFRDLFGLGHDIITSNIELTFDIALHLGTALAVIVYFYNDFKDIFLALNERSTNAKDNNLLLLIIIASIPTAIVGFLFDDYIENVIRYKYYLIAIVLIVVGIIIYFVDSRRKEQYELAELKIRGAFLIGCSQIFALIPGVSRSGATITTSRLFNLKRDEAAKFSFYLSLPVILGATVLQLLKIDLIVLIDNFNILLTGIFTSFLIGIISINCLLRYLKNNNYKLFMWYRIIFGCVIIVYLLMK